MSHFNQFKCLLWVRRALWTLGFVILQIMQKKLYNALYRYKESTQKRHMARLMPHFRILVYSVHSSVLCTD